MNDPMNSTAALAQAVDSIRGTGCGVEIAGVRIEECDECGRTATTLRAEKAEQECRDRECTEQDVRASLADAENALAKVRDLAEKWQADYDNNWNEYGDGYAEDLRAALDGTS